MREANPEFEEDDPMELMGKVGLSGITEDDERRMHRGVVEEYVRLGFSDVALLDLFHNPFYQATHQILKRRGEAYVRGLIRSVRSDWSMHAAAKAE